MATLVGDRVVLRPWREDDYEPFAALNADPEVMRYFPAMLSRAESDSVARRVGALVDERGWGWWAVELHEAGAFVGFVGLADPGFEAPFMPAIEIGWRLAREAWGNGYATEAARLALAYAFDVIEADRVVSFTVPANTRSRNVMTRLGLHHVEGGDFDHPRVPVDSPLRRHVLYEISADEFARARQVR